MHAYCSANSGQCSPNPARETGSTAAFALEIARPDHRQSEPTHTLKPAVPQPCEGLRQSLRLGVRRSLFRTSTEATKAPEPTEATKATELTEHTGVIGSA